MRSEAVLDDELSDFFDDLIASKDERILGAYDDFLRWNPHPNPDHDPNTESKADPKL